LVTVADVLRLALPPGTRVIVGEQQLRLPVTWARSIRGRSALLAGLERGELLLLSLERSTQPVDDRSLTLLIQDLVAAGASALCCVGQLPPRAVESAAQQQLPLLQLPSGTDLAEVERRVVALVVDRESGLRQRVEEVHERLIASLVEDRGPLPLLETLASASGKAVLALDEYLQAADSAGLDPRVVPRVVHGIRDYLLSRWDRTGRPRQVWTIPVDAGAGERQVAVAIPLVLKGTPVGALCLVGPEAAFSDYDERIALRAASVLVLEVAKQRAVEAARLRLQGEFLDDLLAGNFPSEEAFRARARWLGHDLSRPHRVIVLAPDPDGTDGERDQRFPTRLGEGGWLAAMGARADALALFREGRLVVVLPHESPQDEEDARQVAESIRREVLLLSDGARVSAGVGRHHPGLWGFARMYREAERALVVAQTLLGGNCTAAYGELGANRLLGELVSSPELATFYDDHLGKLVEYDRRHNAELQATLEAFFAANSNHVRAARQLHLHRNTLLYRLERIRAILGVDLDDPETRLTLQLALKLKHVARAWRPQHAPRGESLAAQLRSERSAS